MASEVPRGKNVPMSQSTNKVSAVIVGAGIVGNSLAYHLARLGWRDIVLIDKGPMPNPGDRRATLRTSSSRSTTQN